MPVSRGFTRGFRGGNRVKVRRGSREEIEILSLALLLQLLPEDERKAAESIQ